MRTIRVPFKEIARRNPEWGDYVCLIEAVRGRRFSHRAIREFFIGNVDSEEYDRADLKALTAQLYSASNVAEDVHFERKIALDDVISLQGLAMCQT